MRKIEDQIAEQKRWIEEHGGNLTGYIARYGAASDPCRFGAGGEAIYKADSDALRKLEEGARAAALKHDGLRGERDATFRNKNARRYVTQPKPTGKEKKRIAVSLDQDRVGFSDGKHEVTIQCDGSLHAKLIAQALSDGAVEIFVERG